MTRFECLRCGTCCNTILEEVYQVQVGLNLLPDEVKLFDSADVRPLIGIKTSEGIVPVLYQMIRDHCPFYDNGRSACTMYEKRPLVCRAYPFKVVLNVTKFGRCTWLNDLQEKIPIELPSEIRIANEIINAYHRTILGLVKREQILVYTFDREEWVALQEIAARETIKLS